METTEEVVTEADKSATRNNRISNKKAQQEKPIDGVTKATSQLIENFQTGNPNPNPPQIKSKPVTQRRHWGTLTDASTVMVAHRCLPSAKQSNADIDWPVHSLMLPLHDLRGLLLQRLLSTEPCSIIFGSVA